MSVLCHNYQRLNHPAVVCEFTRVSEGHVKPCTPWLTCSLGKR